MARVTGTRLGAEDAGCRRTNLEVDRDGTVERFSSPFPARLQRGYVSSWKRIVRDGDGDEVGNRDIIVCWIAAKDDGIGRDIGEDAGKSICLRGGEMGLRPLELG